MINGKLLGRRVVMGDTVWLSSSGSGLFFEYKNAKSIRILLLGDETVSKEECRFNRPRFRIELDDILFEQGTLSESEQRFYLPLSPLGSSGRVSILKLSEASQSTLGVRIFADGEILPVPDKQKKIEFIGDSITCGYSVDGNFSQVFSTSTENVTKTYAYLAAKALDADACFTCFSGFGIHSGYTGSGERNASILVPDWYEKVGFCDHIIPGHRRVNEYDWDFSLFVPDVIVINLGTNDISYCGNDPVRQTCFQEDYISFLGTVRRRNPEAWILCTLGLMGTTLNGRVKEAVDLYKKETGDPRISFFPLQDQLSSDGYVPDYHPTALTHEKAAEKLIPVLRELIILNEVSINSVQTLRHQ